MRTPMHWGGRSRTAPPPTAAAIRRNDWVLLASVILMMAAGWLVLRWYNRPVTTSAAPGLGELRVPAGWLVAGPGSDDRVLFRATNPTAPGLFVPFMEVAAIEIGPDESLETARATLSLQRSRELDRYRELAAEPVTVLDDKPAVLVSYAWIADPTQDSGGNGLPVVVQAQDLILPMADGWARATVAEDAATFSADAPEFGRFLAGLGLVRSSE